MNRLSRCDLAYSKASTTGSHDAIDVPMRSPNRPRFMKIDVDQIDSSLIHYKGPVDTPSDVSSAEYKLHRYDGSVSTQTSIFSDLKRLEELPEEVDLSEFLDEQVFDAEICTITNVISYLKYRVQMVTF